MLSWGFSSIVKALDLLQASSLSRGSLLLPSYDPINLIRDCKSLILAKYKPVSSVNSLIAACLADSLPGFQGLPTGSLVSWNPPGKAHLPGSALDVEDLFSVGQARLKRF